jgi:hypothetical protein
MKKVTSSSSSLSAVSASTPGLTNEPFHLMSTSSSRRRGRPPKYPRNDIPLIPKVTLTEAEIAARAKVTGDPIIASGFQRYMGPAEKCPDELCVFRAGEHYHCVRARCHHSTNHSDVLSLHAKDFHMYISILDGFEFFDSNVSCRRSHCANNQVNRHFHCTRPGCDYSFVRYSTMVQHDRKHVTSPRDVTAGPRSRVATDRGQGQVAMNDFNRMLAQYNGSTSLASQAVLAGMMLPMFTPILPPNTGVIPSPVLAQYGLAKMAIPRLDKKKTAAPANQPRPIAPKPESGINDAAASLANVKDKMHFAVTDNCGRPFCKLKKRDHFHCVLCNQAFSDSSRLTNHLAKHKAKPSTMTSQVTMNDTQDRGWEEEDGEEREEVDDEDEDGDEETEAADWQVPPFNRSHSLTLDPKTFSGLSNSLTLNPMSFSGLVGAPQVLSVDSDSVGLDLSGKVAAQSSIATSKSTGQSQNAIMLSSQSKSELNGSVTSQTTKRKSTNDGMSDVHQVGISDVTDSGDIRQMVNSRLHQHLNKKRFIKQEPNSTAILTADTV